MNLSECSGSVRVMEGDSCRISRLVIARSFATRAIGLMFRRQIPERYGNGLLFPGCRSLHTFNMRFALDVVFLDRDGQPVRIVCGVKPWRIVTGPADAVHCLEIRAGTFEGTTLPQTAWSYESLV